jgi:acyl carrier protein
MDRTEIKKLLAEVLTETTGETFGALDEEQTLKDHLKLDSLDLVSMAIELQARVGATVEASEITGIVTVGDLVGLLQTKLAKQSTTKAA